MTLTQKIYLTNAIKNALDAIKKDIDGCEGMMKKERIKEYSDPEKTVSYYKNEITELKETESYLKELLETELQER